MFSKTKIALAAALIAGSASVAFADGEFDPNLANRYPAYNGPVATGTFQSAPVGLERRGQLRSAPVRLQNQDTFGGTFQEPISHGAGRAPGAFYQQEQPGYPQSPPGGGY
jgi:hypothetical protein